MTEHRIDWDCNTQSLRTTDQDKINAFVVEIIDHFFFNDAF
jgi:hypothetical protein